MRTRWRASEPLILLYSIWASALAMAQSVCFLAVLLYKARTGAKNWQCEKMSVGGASWVESGWDL
jgi:hypothetical protein